MVGNDAAVSNCIADARKDLVNMSSSPGRRTCCKEATPTHVDAGALIARTVCHGENHSGLYVPPPRPRQHSQDGYLHRRAD